MIPPGSASASSRRHVDTIAVDIVAVADDVADVDADTEFDAPVSWHFDIAIGHGALNIDGAADGVDHADELHEHPVSGRLDDAATVLGDLGVDQFLAMRLKLAQRAFLIGAHQPTVAGDVASEYRSQSAVNAVFRHVVDLQLLER
jgi:hypothetical protein